MRLIQNHVAASVLAIMTIFASVAAISIVDASISQVQAQAISGVDVSGNQRISRDTILTYVTVEAGQNASAVKIDESIQALFATGLFKDVSIARSGSRLSVVVVENPIVNGVSFVGNKKLEDKDLRSASLTKARGTFSQDQVDADVLGLKQAYKAIGRFNATVKATVTPLDRNRVNVTYRIDESDKTGIAKIRFVGNKVFGDGRLKNAISTRQTGLLSFLKSDDIYDEARLAADEERLRRFYFNHGYADFEVISSVVDLDESKNKFFITVTVSEGARYRFGEIEIDSILLDVDPEELRPLLKTKKGAIYDARKVERTIEALSLAAAEKGFAFAQVRPRGEQAPDNRINITYAIDQGARVFVERINILGNTRTREYVVRREFDLAEGDAFNQALINQAERRIRNLGIFKEVRITRSQGTAADRVVVNIELEEQPTGDISFGLGADLSGGFLTNVSITERNFLGRGQFLRAAVGLGTGNQTYDFSFTEPFFLGRRVSAGFDVFRRDSQDQDGRSFDVSNTGVALRLGLPLTDNLSLGVRYTFDRETISDVDDEAPLSIQSVVGASGESDSDTSSISYSVSYNSLDNNQKPTNGIQAVFEQEFAGLGGDVQFIKTDARISYYKELNANHEVIGLLRGRVGNIQGLGQQVRILDNFFAGGDLVRGFENRGIGPRDGDTTTGDDALGGTNFFGLTAEVQFPVPGLPRSFGLKAALFADAGSVYGFDQQTDVTPINGSTDVSVRSSVGVGFLWDSPLGPLRGDFAYVTSSEDFDDEQFFRIGGGTRF
ncbi:MAG: outer membrane protein assembly factor BamA [Hyphomicrobiales bacterium]